MYLYGDSTESPLRSNFLEFLRGAVDFGVYVLLADARIADGKREIVDLERRAAEEIARLEGLEDIAARAISKAPCGAPDSATSRCAQELGRLTHAAIEGAIAEVRASLTRSIADVHAKENAERDGCFKALERLLMTNETWDAIVDRRAVLRVDTVPPTYAARTGGISGSGLAWLIDLGIPDGHVFSQVVRLERLAPQIEVAVPDLAGWLKKEVKAKALRFDRLCLAEIFMDDDILRAKLRLEPGSETGFDMEVQEDVPVGQPRVRMARVGTKDVQLDGPFDVRAEDEPALIALGAKLREALEELVPRRLVEATFDDAPFHRYAQLRSIVERLVAEMAPQVREISAHSLSPTELVVKRLLADDRREEVFVSKASLRERISLLPPSSRGVFDALGLTPALPAAATASPAPPVATPAVPKVESEVATPPVPVVAPRPVPVPASARPAPAREPSSNGAESRPSLDIVLIEDDESAPKLPLSTAVTPAPPPVARAKPPVPPSRGAPTTGAPPPASARQATKSTTDGIVAAIQDIQAIQNRGENELAYQQYAHLFGSDPFASCSAEVQRQALRLMIKTEPNEMTEPAKRAYRAAIDRLNLLVAALDDPADYELLGICQLRVDDTAAASATFATGLALERKRDPGSELCENLTRRVHST
jgi:hypothetical protein